MQPQLVAGWMQPWVLFMVCWAVAATECPKTVRRQRDGIIESADYPQPYPRDSCQQWDISGNPGDTITLSMTDLNIPDDPQVCQDSYLIIGPIPIRRICGNLNGSHPLVYISQTDHVTLRFYGSGRVPGRGFHLRYVLGKVPNDWQCSDQHWKCGNGKCIPDQWHCNTVDECGDHSDETGCSAIQIQVLPDAKACGQDQFGCQAMSGQFECHWISEMCDGHRDCLHNEDEASCDGLTSCGGLLQASSGFLRSPGYYTTNGTCVWRIQVTYGHQIQLRFQHFALSDSYPDNRYQYVAVYNGDSENSDLLGRFDDDHPPPRVIESYSNWIFIKYSSHGNDGNAFGAIYQTKGICLPDQLSCEHGEMNCYYSQQRCDQVWDCSIHGADERGCEGCSNVNMFSCGDASLSCYNMKDHCNGITQCTNHQDELHCSKEQCGTHNGTYLCQEGRCIYESWLCDGTPDCPLGDDEKACTATSVKVVTAAVIGTLACALLLVVAMGCLCKLHGLRVQDQSAHGLMGWHPSPEEMMARAMAPPQYMEAMLTSRNYDEVQEEFLSLTRGRDNHTENTNDDVPLLADTDLLQARSDDIILDLSSPTDGGSNPGAPTTSCQQTISQEDDKQGTLTNQSSSNTTVHQTDKSLDQTESNQSMPVFQKSTSADTSDNSAMEQPSRDTDPSPVPDTHVTVSPAGLASAEQEGGVTNLEVPVDTHGLTQQVS